MSKKIILIDKETGEEFIQKQYSHELYSIRLDGKVYVERFSGMGGSSGVDECKNLDWKVLETQVVNKRSRKGSRVIKSIGNLIILEDNWIIKDWDILVDDYCNEYKVVNYGTMERPRPIDHYFAMVGERDIGTDKFTCLELDKPIKVGETLYRKM